MALKFPNLWTSPKNADLASLPEPTKTHYYQTKKLMGHGPFLFRFFLFDTMLHWSPKALPSADLTFSTRVVCNILLTWNLCLNSIRNKK